MIEVQIEDLPEHKNPIFNYCRKLKKEGVDENAVIAFYRGTTLCMQMKIKDGAELATYEREDRCGRSISHGFCKYRPFIDAGTVFVKAR